MGSPRRMHAFALVCLVVLTSGVADAQDGPTYDGKDVEEWADLARGRDAGALFRLARDGADAHPMLRALLRHEDPDVVRGAVTAVAFGLKTSGPLVPDLAGLLGHDDVGIRAQAAGTLGLFPDHEATRPALLRAIRDDHVLVRVVALGRLEEMGRKVAKAAVILTEALHAAGPRERLLAATICGRIGNRALFAVPRLVELLDAPESRVVLAAATTLLKLRRHPKDTLATFLAGLEHPVEENRKLTVAALRRHRDEARQLAELVTQMFDSDEPDARRAALGFMLVTGVEPERSAEALISGLTVEDDEAYLKTFVDRYASALAPEVRTEIAKRLADPSVEIRRVAARLVGRHRASPETAGPLVGAALSEDSEVRDPALSALERLEAEARAEAIREYEDAVVEALGDPARRAGALRLLGWSAPDGKVGLLRAALRSGAAQVRAHAAYTLVMNCPDARETPKLLAACLSDPSSAVRSEALIGITALAPRHDIPAGTLPELLRDPDPSVRILAVNALATARATDTPSLGRQDFRTWVAKLGSDSFEEWYDIKRRLARRGASAVRMLRAARLVASPDARRRIVDTLAELTEHADVVVPELAAALRDPERWVRRDAIGALTEFGGHPLAPALLLRSLDDPDASCVSAAALALAKIGAHPERVAVHVTRAIEDGPQDVSFLSAIEAVGRLGDHARPLVPRIIELFEAEKDAGDYVKIVCARALARLGAHVDGVLAYAADLLATEDGNLRDSGREIIADLGERGRGAAAPFVARLAGPVDLERLRVATVLISVDLEAGKAAALLVAARVSPDRSVRARAEEISGDWEYEPPPGLVAGLGEVMRSGTPRIRLAAIEMMRESYGEEAYTDPIVRALGDPDPSVRKVARRAVGMLPEDRTLPLLREMAGGPPGPGRDEARRQLAFLGREVDPEPEKPWNEVLESGTVPERIAVIKEIASADDVTPEQLAALETCLKDPSVSIRYYAKKALKKIAAREKK